MKCLIWLSFASLRVIFVHLAAMSGLRCKSSRRSWLGLSFRSKLARQDLEELRNELKALREELAGFKDALKRIAIFGIQGVPESGLAVIPRKGDRWPNHIRLHCVAVSLRLSRTGQ